MTLILLTHSFMLLLTIFFFEIRYYLTFNEFLTNFIDLFTYERFSFYISFPAIFFIIVSFIINIKLYKKANQN